MPGFQPPRFGKATARLARCALLAFGVAAAPALAADLFINQKNKTFSVPAMQLHVGDNLHFLNSDNVNHNITVRGDGDDADSEDLGIQKPGGSVSYLFRSAGSYRVICSIHPRMKMTVTVK